MSGLSLLLSAGSMFALSRHEWYSKVCTEQPSQSDPKREDTAGQFQVNDLRKGLKKLLKTGCSRGFSNKTIYVLAWMAARPHIQGEISNDFWASPQVTTSMLTMILKYRYGQLWNMKFGSKGHTFRV